MNYETELHHLEIGDYIELDGFKLKGILKMSLTHDPNANPSLAELTITIAVSNWAR